MGALTSYTKRDHPNNPFDYSFHVSKKARFSYTREKYPGHTLAVGSSNSTVSRVSRYPETSAPRKWKREVHAPCRVVKFGLGKPKGEGFSAVEGGGEDRMGNSLSRRLDLAKKSAIGAFRYLGRDKELVEVDDEDNRPEDARPWKQPEKGMGYEEDSVVEVIEMIEDDGVAGSDKEVRDNDGNGDDDIKIVEERSVVTIDGDGSSGAAVENAGKVLGSLALCGDPGEGGVVDVSSVEVYKKLLENMERRSRRLRQLNFEIEFNEKKWSLLQSSRPSKKPEKEAVAEVPREPFIPLTSEEEAEINRAFSPSNRRKILVSHENTNIDITGEALQCLRPTAWLNDEVINVYLELLKEREKREPQKFLKCHFFNTFFYKKLTSGGYNYKAVKRWTTEKKLGYFLIDCDKIFIPVHREIHWCLAIINKKDQKFQYLDSLKGRDYAVLENLAKYYTEEVKDKSRKDIDVSNWQREFPEDLPEQQNGYDCGMFMIKYADFYSRGLGLCFSQEHMPYFRLRTAKEILRLRAD